MINYRNVGLESLDAGEALLHAQRYEESIEALACAADLLAASDDRENEARALMHLGLAHSLLGQWDDGNQAYQRAYEISRQSGDHGAAALARIVLGGNLVDSGHPQQALPHLCWGLEEARRIGEVELQQTATHHLEVAQRKLTQRRG